MKSERNPPILILTVNYQGIEDTLRCLGSAGALEHASKCLFFVIDNGSEASELKRLKEAEQTYGNVRCLASGTNLGYFGGAEWGLQCYLKEYQELPDWVIVCNNDIELHQSDFFARLLRAPKDVGIIAPTIVSMRDGNDQNPYMSQRPSTWEVRKHRFWFSRYEILKLKATLSPVVRKIRQKIRSTLPIQPNSKGRIYAPHGAFIIFSREFFNRGGTIDTGAFLYHEEISAAELSLSVGLPVIYDPELKVWHNEHRTTGAGLKRTTYRFKKQAFDYILKRYWADL